jgi:hypothetical protein
MKKKSMLNIRITEELSDYINSIVESDNSIKNRSDLAIRAVQYYLEKEHNIILDEVSSDLNKVLQKLIGILPPHLKKRIDEEFGDETSVQALEEAYREYFFLYGLEDMINIEEQFLSGEGELPGFERKQAKELTSENNSKT